MSAQALIEELQEAGVHLALVDGRLRYLATRGPLPPELRERLASESEGIAWELSLASASRAPGSRPRETAWRIELERSLRAVLDDAEGDPQLLEERVAGWIEAAEERVAILEFDAGLSRAEAEERALEMAVAELEPEPEPLDEPVVFTEVCDLRPSRGPHDSPLRGCYACGGRAWWRLRALSTGAPGAWTCERCHPLQPAEAAIERRKGAP